VETPAPYGIFSPDGGVYAHTPLIYRFSNETILRTATMWAYDPWFLAEPMLILGAAGFFYHLGVRVGGVSLSLRQEDNTEYYLSLPSIKGVQPGLLFVIGSS